MGGAVCSSEGFYEVQGFLNSPAALVLVFRPLVNSAHCVHEHFSDVAIQRKIVSSLFCI